MNDKWARIIGAPVIAILMQFVHDGPAAFNDWHTLLPHVGVSLTITVTIWEGIRGILVLMRRLFPRYDQTGRRLLFQTLSSLVYTYLATVSLNWVLQVVVGIVLCPQGEVWHNYLANLVPTLFVTSLYESALFFGEWKKNLQRSEALARAALQTELEALQRQLDPHFLFNSLNTLSALIDDTNAEAQRFVEQLSDVYRYVLLSRDKTTVTLSEELAFVDAYVALNKTRFRDDLLVEHHIAPGAGAGTVAPLSVQMLIENALKHNVISPENPLRVTLQAEMSPANAGYVSVANNLQPKTGLSTSTKVGLRNIIDRYRLLTQQPVEVSREAGFFTVRLPLLS
ncbi:sensor histidine kinase [Hymenobacter terrenus]|uniref:sensor histidine kinase n=1 Tax=Hymenobacter terrenus TaxID=1629124 RepID=UPI00061A0324|nr:sensor histidine kinase [Hymenobacter terrenus]